MRGKIRNNVVLGVQRGVILPAALFLSIFVAIAILLIANRIITQSKVGVASFKSMRGGLSAQSGIQLGLARMSNRVAMIYDKINNGVDLQSGGKFWPNDQDMLNYANINPGQFWLDIIRDYHQPDETVFTIDHLPNEYLAMGASPLLQAAKFEINTAKHHIEIRIVYVGNTQGTALINDVTLRYGYDILAVDLATGKKERVTSFLSDQATQISLHMKRPLSRYNLFADFNTDPAGVPVFDSVSYSGPVYTIHKWHQQANSLIAPKSPTFGSTFEIATDPDIGDPSALTNHGYCERRDPPADLTTGQDCFCVKNTVGNPDCVLGDDLIMGQDARAMPGIADQSWQKSIACTWATDVTAAGYAASGASSPCDDSAPDGVYVQEITVGSNVSPKAIYVKGNATINISKPAAGQTKFEIDWGQDGSNEYPLTGHDGIQHVGDLQAQELIIYVLGNLKVKGLVANDTKLTIAADGDINLMGSLAYETAPPNQTTVIGLVSWEGNILVGKSIPGTPPIQVLLHAVVMSVTGGFGSEGWDYVGGAGGLCGAYTAAFGSANVYRGQIQHQGSFIRKYSLPTITPTTNCGWGLTSNYDSALQYMKAPPYFPGNGHYGISPDDRANIHVVDRYRIH